MPLRFPPARPAGNQIYFIGATNVPLEALDPAIQRPGRMGRHVWFRTPTKHDREDIFDLYLGKVSHDPELDTARARDELARITNGYSPAMVEQVCSMALTRAHHEGRLEFTRDDIIEAMTTVESGTAVGVEYVPEETRAVAIHEAGHAADRARLPEGRRVDADLDPACAPARSATTRRSRRRSASAPGSTRRWEARLDARRDGRGARLLRRERDRRRRRPPERDRPGGVDGRRLGHGPRHGRAERQGAHAGEEGRGAREGREAVRGARPPADEPRERRLPARRDRLGARRPDEAPAAPPRSSARRTSTPTTSSSRTRTRSRRSPTRSSPGGSSTATSSSTCSTRPGSRSRSST